MIFSNNSIIGFSLSGGNPIFVIFTFFCKKNRIINQNPDNTDKNRFSITSLLFPIGLGLLLFGLLYSRFALSAGMGCLLLHGLLAHPLHETLRAFKRQRVLVALTSVFFLYLLTGIYSCQQAYFWQQMRIILPFLFLPFCFAQPHFTTLRQRQRWLLFYFSLVAISAIFTTGILWQRHQTLLLTFTDGVYLPTVIHHVRFSLMVAFAIFVGHHLYCSYQFRAPFMRQLVGVAKLFLVFFLHLIAVRSGLFGFYAVLLWLLLRGATWRQRWLGLVAILLGGSVIYIALPSWQHQVQATWQSLQAIFQNAPIAHTSDLGRWQSIRAGLQVFSEHPLLGVGLGDIEAELNLVKPLNADEMLLPHNQFVFLLTFSGLVGVVWFGLVWLSLPLSLMPKRNRTDYSKYC